MIEILKKILQEKAPTIDMAAVTLGTEIKSLGIDSLDFVEVIYQIETDFNIEIPADALSQVVTVQQLLTVIEQAIAPA